MGEYEPRDSRNVTGTAATKDGHWTNTDGRSPRADGAPKQPAEAGDLEDEPVAFEPDPALEKKIREGTGH